MGDLLGAFGLLFFVASIGTMLYAIGAAIWTGRRNRGVAAGRRTTNTLSSTEFHAFMRMAKRRVLHEDRDENGLSRQLVRVPLAHEEDVFAVRVFDTTTKKETYIRVRPGHKSCHAAISNSFGLPPEEYSPVREA